MSGAGDSDGAGLAQHQCAPPPPRNLNSVNCSDDGQAAGLSRQSGQSHQSDEQQQPARQSKPRRQAKQQDDQHPQEGQSRIARNEPQVAQSNLSMGVRMNRPASACFGSSSGSAAQTGQDEQPPSGKNKRSPSKKSRTPSSNNHLIQLDESTATTTTPPRPASALAGLNNHSKPTSDINHQSNCNQPPRPPMKSYSSHTTPSKQPQPMQLQQPPQQQQQQHQLRTKATRVRINSTSEQIQDPNWLIEISRGLEADKQRQKQKQKRPKMAAKSHLKLFHQKLKSTIQMASPTNSSSAHHSGSPKTEASGRQPIDSSGSSCTTNQLLFVDQQQQQHHQQPNESSVLPASSPLHAHLVQPHHPQQPPVKVPVSILKQPTSSAAPHAGLSPGRANQHANSHHNNNAKLSPIQSHSRYHQQPPPPQQQQQQQQPTSATARSPHRATKQSQANSNQNKADETARLMDKQQLDEQQQQQQVAGKCSAAQLKASQRPEPICAHGQVKVSGWKRNNLLAKTLTHFDVAIRGNQRPVFAPTKIVLPTAAGQATSAPPDGAQRNTKFAKIVREAISKKRDLLAEQEQQAQPQQRQKRGSESELKEPPQPATTTTTTTTGAKQRPVSAEPGASLSSWPALAGQQHQRPSITTTPPTLTSAASNKQQSIGQLLAAAVASNESAAGGCSSRSLKLQLKNEQVLQNLRRQSNEMVGHLQHQSEPVTGETSSQLQASQQQQQQQQQHQQKAPHLKDWKRLTNKLGLLTSQHARNQQRQAFVRSATGSPTCPASGADTPSQSGLAVAASHQLRLTLSNQENSSGHQRVGAAGGGGGGGGYWRQTAKSHLAPLLFSQQHLQLQHRQPNDSEAAKSGRKLSSSSMIVGQNQLINSAAAAGAPISRSCANSPMLSVRQGELEMGAGQSRLSSATAAAAANHLMNLRRSSDSEAYRATKRRDEIAKQQERANIRSIKTHNDDHRPATSTSGGGGGGETRCDGAPPDDGREAADGAPREWPGAAAKAAPIVVNRDDLLQLIKVTTSAPGGSLNSLTATGNNNSNNNNPITTSILVENNGRKSAASSRTSMSSSGDLAASPAAIAAAAAAAASSSTRTLLAAAKRPRQAQDDQQLSEDAHARLGAPANTRSGQKDDNSTPPPPPAQNDEPNDVRPGEHFSLVVKKTSKVALIQQRLRKMRWTIRERKRRQQAEQGVASASACNPNGPPHQELEGPAHADQKVEDAGQQQQQQQQQQEEAKSSDVFVDPTLIGDAIEIFLRTTMQQQQQQPPSSSYSSASASASASTTSSSSSSSNSSPSSSTSTSSSSTSSPATSARHPVDPEIDKKTPASSNEDKDEARGSHYSRDVKQSESTASGDGGGGDAKVKQVAT